MTRVLVSADLGLRTSRAVARQAGEVVPLRQIPRTASEGGHYSRKSWHEGQRHISKSKTAQAKAMLHGGATRKVGKRQHGGWRSRASRARRRRWRRIWERRRIRSWRRPNPCGLAAESQEAWTLRAIC